MKSKERYIDQIRKQAELAICSIKGAIKKVEDNEEAEQLENERVENNVYKGYRRSKEYV